MAKVALLIPNNTGSLPTRFVKSLLAVILFFNEWNKKNGNKHSLDVFFQEKGYDISFMREQLANAAMRDGFEILIHMDSDMVFPPDLATTMIENFERNPELEAVSGLYHYKTYPYPPHFYHEYDEAEDKFSMVVGWPMDRLTMIHGAGFGCLALRREVYEQIPKPWFRFVNGVLGEDLGFFRKFIKTNNRPVRMALNPLLRCGHLTQVEVGFDSYLKANGLKVEKNTIQVPKEILERINEFKQKATEGYASVVTKEYLEGDICVLCMDRIVQKK